MVKELRTRQTQDPKHLLKLAPDGRIPWTQASSHVASVSRTAPISQTLPPTMMVPMLKKAKPLPFSGEDTSLAIVNAWIFKSHAHVRTSIDKEKKVETVASFLTSTAELWLMAKYLSAAQLPTFDEFI